MNELFNPLRTPAAVLSQRGTANAPQPLSTVTNRRLFRWRAPRLLLLLASALLLSAGVAEASHFRGATLTWKRLASPANTIEVTVTESWRGDNVDCNGYNWGDGTSFNTCNGTLIATGSDATGSFGITRTVVSHTYSSEGPWTIESSSCCRIGSFVNDSSSWVLISEVDLRNGNQGAPAIGSPIVVQMAQGRVNNFQLSFADADQDSVTFRLATSSESGITSPPSAGGKTLSVSSGGLLTWDTSDTSVDQLYTAQVIASDNHAGSGTSRVFFDFIIHIVDASTNRAPVASGDSGPFTASVGQPFSNTITGTDEDGGNLTVTHQGLPSGATLTPPSGTTAPQPLAAKFDWTPTQADAGSSVSVTIIFTDPGGLQASKSFTVVVSAKADPTLTTQASGTSAVGGTITDTATLSGGSSPTGTITFNLFGPDNATCAGTPVFTSSKTVNGNGNYTSDPYTPTSPGTYRWVASYNGDSGNNAVSGACNDPNESVTVQEQPTIHFSSSSYSVDENDGSVVLTVVRDGGTATSVSANYTSSNTTATAPADYTANNGTMTFAAGETVKTITVVINDDAQFEGEETFSVTLSSPGGGARLVAPAAALVRIFDNDPQPTPTATPTPSPTPAPSPTATPTPSPTVTPTPTVSPTASPTPSATPSPSASPTASPSPSPSPSPSATPQAQAFNLSTRGTVQSGENVLISGFIVQGPAGATKNTLLRGLGPSLAGAEVANPLPDPHLELFNGAGESMLPNNNWKDTQRTDIERTGLQPQIDLESAIVANLPSGNYTAIFRSADDRSGTGLAEIYNLNPSAEARMVNISTRGRVGTQQDVLIGGFIVQGTGAADVLVRGIGPSLASRGVVDELQNPTLTLVDGNGNSTFNDDWQSNQRSQIEATTIPPSDPRESAIRATLTPGNYTAVLAGQNDSTGVGLVEFYDLSGASGSGQ